MRWWVAGAAVMAAALVAVLLVTLGGEDGGGAEAPRVTGPFTAHRPPLHFQPEGELADAVGVRSAALDGARAYVHAYGRLKAVDLATRRTLWSVRQSGPLPRVNPGDPPPHGTPVRVRYGGRDLVLVAFANTGVRAELVAVDTATGTEAWRAPWRTMEGRSAVRCAVSATTTLRGGGVAAVACEESNRYVTYGIAFDGARRLLWQRPDVEARFPLAGARVAAMAWQDTDRDGRIDSAPMDTGRAAALDVRTGRTLWTGGRHLSLGPGRELLPFSPHFVLAGADLLDVRTGRREVPAGFAAGHEPVVSCSYDQRAHTYCSFYGGELAAYEAAGARLIWRRGGDHEAAVSPSPSLPRSVTAAWYGLVYGLTQDGEGVVMDGLTGRILEDDSGAAPDLVNEFAALEAAADRAWNSPVAVHRTVPRPAPAR